MGSGRRRRADWPRGADRTGATARYKRPKATRASPGLRLQAAAGNAARADGTAPTGRRRWSAPAPLSPPRPLQGLGAPAHGRCGVRCLRSRLAWLPHLQPGHSGRPRRRPYPRALDAPPLRYPRWAGRARLLVAGHWHPDALPSRLSCHARCAGCPGAMRRLRPSFVSAPRPLQLDRKEPHRNEQADEHTNEHAD